MFRLSNTSSFAIKSPADTYIYDIVPLSSGSIAAISSDDCLRILNPLNLERGEVNLVKGVGKDITCLRNVNAEGGEVVVTAGRDGAVSLTDLRGARKVGGVRSGECSVSVKLRSGRKYERLQVRGVLV
jgi:SEL1 protein